MKYHTLLRLHKPSFCENSYEQQLILIDQTFFHYHDEKDEGYYCKGEVKNSVIFSLTWISDRISDRISIIMMRMIGDDGDENLSDNLQRFAQSSIDPQSSSDLSCPPVYPSLVIMMMVFIIIVLPLLQFPAFARALSSKLSVSTTIRRSLSRRMSS